MLLCLPLLAGYVLYGISTILLSFALRNDELSPWIAVHREREGARPRGRYGTRDLLLVRGRPSDCVDVPCPSELATARIANPISR